LHQLILDLDLEIKPTPQTSHTGNAIRLVGHLCESDPQFSLSPRILGILITLVTERDCPRLLTLLGAGQCMSTHSTWVIRPQRFLLVVLMAIGNHKEKRNSFLKYCLQLCRWSDLNASKLRDGHLDSLFLSFLKDEKVQYMYMSGQFELKASHKFAFELLATIDWSRSARVLACQFVRSNLTILEFLDLFLVPSTRKAYAISATDPFGARLNRRTVEAFNLKFKLNAANSLLFGLSATVNIV
jgi:hypothetical protein